MTKAKIILAGICLFSGIGGAIAFKARATTAYIKTGSGSTQYKIVQVVQNCTIVGEGCLYTSINGATFQLYQIGALNHYYYIRQ